MTASLTKHRSKCRVSNLQFPQVLFIHVSCCFIHLFYWAERKKMILLLWSGKRLGEQSSMQLYHDCSQRASNPRQTCSNLWQSCFLKCFSPPNELFETYWNFRPSCSTEIVDFSWYRKYSKIWIRHWKVRFFFFF